MEEFVFGTKEAVTTPPFVVSPSAPATFQPVPESMCPLVTQISGRSTRQFFGPKDTKL